MDRVQDRDYLLAVVYAVMNVRVYKGEEGIA
jgi:hypothetical protein